MADPKVALRRRTDSQIVSVHAPRAGADAVVARCADVLRIPLEAGPRRAERESVASLGIGPGRWLLVRTGEDPDWVASITAALSDVAAVCDQSDAYVIFEASGSEAFDVLARGIPVDLHPAVMPSNGVAVTQLGHINVILWQTIGADRRTLCMAVGRSYADSFDSHWH